MKVVKVTPSDCSNSSEPVVVISHYQNVVSLWQAFHYHLVVMFTLSFLQCNFPAV